MEIPQSETFNPCVSTTRSLVPHHLKTRDQCRAPGVVNNNALRWGTRQRVEYESAHCYRSLGARWVIDKQLSFDHSEILTELLQQYITRKTWIHTDTDTDENVKIHTHAHTRTHRLRKVAVTQIWEAVWHYHTLSHKQSYSLSHTIILSDTL